MERRSSDAVDPQPGIAAMHRIKHQPLRNKINLAEPTQVRAWTRRLGISADSLKAFVDKVGNSIAAVTKEVELQRASHQASPERMQSRPAEGELPAPV
jgi:predicted nucleic acid-binding Zn ribbon protein